MRNHVVQDMSDYDMADLSERFNRLSLVEAEPLPTPIIVVYTNLGVLLVSNGTSVLIYYNVFV